MKTPSADLTTLFATRNFFAANLFTITCVSGLVLRYTSADYDVTYGSNKFLCGGFAGPFFERGTNSGGSAVSCQWKAGLEVSTLTVDIIPGLGTVNGVPFLTACINGVFDGATFKRERAYGAKGGQAIAGTVVLDVGRITEIQAGRSYATFSVADFRELLNVNMPQKLYQPGCINSLYDANCGLNKADFTSTDAARAGSTRCLIETGLTQPDGYFDQGVITFTGGANTGVSRTVKAYVGGSVTTIAPFPSTPAIGDAFSIYRGCLKTTDACAALGNSPKFRGFKTLPDPTTSL